jgi:formamidopyrimidine-DNA glycosylase
MPEQSEVATVAEQLDILFSNRILNKLLFVESYKKTPSNLREFNKHLPKKIKRVSCKGKKIFFTFYSSEVGGSSEAGKSEICIFSGLGMTGRYTTDEIKHIKATFSFEVEDEHYPFNIQNLYFSDPRPFGNFKLTLTKKEKKDTLNELAGTFIGKYKLSEKEFLDNCRIFKNRKLKQRNLIEVFRDSQSYVCSGIGNYLFSEIMYKCNLDPWMMFNDLTKDDLKNIYKYSVEVIEKSYECSGLSIKDYKDLFGNNGKYEEFLEVYNQKETTKGEKVLWGYDYPNKKDKRKIWYVESQINKK